jgi:hypothetical protein
MRTVFLVMRIGTGFGLGAGVLLLLSQVVPILLGDRSVPLQVAASPDALTTNVAFPLILTLSVPVSLVLGLVAGARAARHTGNISTGVASGAVEGAVAGAVGIIVAVVIALTLPDALLVTWQAPYSAVALADKRMVVADTNVVYFGFLLVLLAVGGALAGAFGGSFGRRHYRSPVLPSQEQPWLYG